MSAVVKDGYRWVILRDRKRVPGLLGYDSYEEAELALFRYDPRCRNDIRNNLYFIHRELAR